ncbi:(2,3-dihydroxybenzoyl)adenylate synthase [Rhodococcus sp. 2G]|uniref:(2,3-dihydroxybenzoyl)adenylate synthase n=1 Tax=Rhodococcus sp. 2G TaxID=1570939 RepID=UPI0009040588|nr:AMP-binding protein [Rhodococcus sp. 2G]
MTNEKVTDHVPWPEETAELYRATGCWAGITFGQMLSMRAAEHGERLAVRDPVRDITYKELDAAAFSLAAGLDALGLQTGDRVVLQVPNTVYFVEVLFALFRLGVVPVMALPAHRHAELAALSEASGAVAIIVPHDTTGFSYEALAYRIRREVPTIQHVITVGPDGVHASSTQTGLFDLRLAPGKQQPEPAANAVALLMLSGGSTGTPKLIPRTHDDYLYSVRRSAEVCGLGPSSVYLAVLPAAHNFTLSSPGILGTLWAGGTVALTADPSPSGALSFASRTGANLTALVPPLARLWADTAERSAQVDSALAVIQIGGARCSTELAVRIRSALGVQVQQVFGMAEGLVCYTPLDGPDDIVLNTQGRPMSALDEVRVVDDLGVPVNPGEPGHLMTRGPYTIRGYFRNPEANCRSFTTDGWYRTGDIVSASPEGSLTVHGRTNDLINRGGEKVSPTELERQLLRHPAVGDVIAVGLPDETLGERICVFIVPAGLTGPSLLELRAFARQSGLADWKLPDEIRIVSDFPKTRVGKDSRAALRNSLRG